MKVSFINILNDSRNKFFYLLFLLACPAFAFQTENKSDALRLLEAGLATKDSAPSPIYYLGTGEYQKALDALTPEDAASFPWLKVYLDGVVRVTSTLEKTESDHFVMFTPPGRAFLAAYALPVLEKDAAYLAGVFGTRPEGKIRVEVYPTKEDFSAASTLSMETLERSGAIGICKFHRLMIVSPEALPLGYRWLDALSHEYVHLNINYLSASRAELWLHEGTARYFETAYRATPPLFLTPDQKTRLKKGSEEKTLVPFARMSPSLVYLKDQDEVSLAFAQVAYAINWLINKFGEKKFVSFLNSLKTAPFSLGFMKAYGMSPEIFESTWQTTLSLEKWDKTQGTISDDVRFAPVDDVELVGAETQAKIRLGDRMRAKGYLDAALVEYEKALTEEPDNAVVLLKAARTYAALGQKEKVMPLLQRAVDKNPNYVTPYIDLAVLKTGEDAVNLLLQANAINPFVPDIHRMLAENYKTMGKMDEAKREEGILALLSR